MKSFALASVCGCCALLASAQIPSEGFNRELLSAREYELNNWKISEHQTLQPAARGLEPGYYALTDTSYSARAYRREINFVPVVDLSAGGQPSPEVRGIGWGVLGVRAEWNYENRWTASLGAAVAGGALPGYVNDMADSIRVIPGWGYVRRDGDIRYTPVYTGHIGYKAGKYFHLEAGNGVHFWGDGRRSLILSDVASPFPYFKVDTRIWRIRYTNIWARMEDIHGERSFRDRRGKYVAMHGLSWNLSRDVNITFFEMVVWQDRDSLSRRTIDFHYLNPVLFYRPVEYAQGSADNVIMGLSFRVKAKRNLQVYGQLVLDEFLSTEIRARRGWWANKFGGQAGVKWFNAFTPGLHIQAEVNAVRPFTYTHGSPVQAWGHLNQPLAHPMGANFFEFLLALRYQRGKWNFSEIATWANYGRDIPGLNQGGNIFQSYRNPSERFYNSLNQGIRHIFHYQQFQVSRPLGGGRFEGFASYTTRYEEGGGTIRLDHLFLVGIRTSGFLRNQLDF
ncbi:MAG: hypothetical protein ACK500_05415 [Flavobacteriales bacterium]|jgi:hypothetical protein